MSSGFDRCIIIVDEMNLFEAGKLLPLDVDIHYDNDSDAPQPLLPLCWQGVVKENMAYAITSQKRHVTCSDCKEWIHA